MNDYRNFIGKNDLNTIETNFKILMSIIDLNGYDIWVFYPSTKKLEKDFKFVKSVGNLLFLNREVTSQNGKEYTSNTIVEIGKVIIFYGKLPKINVLKTIQEPIITAQQKQRFMQTFKKGYIKTKFKE
jgi:hypothetical protein